MQEEYDSILKNDTWDLVKLPSDKKAIGCRWVYKMKYQSDGAIDKYKARLVAKGYAQTEGVDFEETFAPVAKMTTIRMLINLASHSGWELQQMDVKSAFLHGILDEEVYMRQPKGFVQVGQEHLVCRLKKALYGLKQAPRAWYSFIDDYFISSGFTRCESDHSLYLKHEGGEILVVILYVDDLIITGSNTSQINYLKKQLSEAFEMSDLDLLHYYLGMEFWQKGDIIFVC
eukprot:Gb_17559 [translate_table: standard]